MMYSLKGKYLKVKKKIILIVIIIILGVLDVYLFSTYIYGKYRNKLAIENSDVELASELSSIPFSVNKIILYSSAYGENENTNFQSSDWILDIFQYTDIAIYLDGNKAIKELSISNISLADNQHLYYLDGTEFGTANILSDCEITNTLDFTVLNFDNNDNSIGYNTPIFFADCSNPITLKYVNNLYSSYTIANTEKLAFDGTLLSKTNVQLDDLKVNISFDINLKDYDNNSYYTTIYLTIPVKNSSSSILDGYVYEENTDLNIQFWKDE